MVFSRQECWSGLLFPSLEDLRDPGIKSTSLASLILAEKYFITGVTWEAQEYRYPAAKSLRSHPILCDPLDSSLLGSSVPGILQAGILEWVAISFSNAWKWKVKVKSLSHVRLFATLSTVARQAPLSMGFSRQEYWSGLPFLSPYPSLITYLSPLFILYFPWMSWP